MDRREFLGYCVKAGATLGLTGISACTTATPGVSQADRTELTGLRIADAHAHPHQLHGSKSYDPTTPTVEMMKRVGMSACSFSAVGDWVKYPGRSGIAHSDTQAQLRKVRAFEEHKQVHVIRHTPDLQAMAFPADALGAIMAIEGGDALEDSIKLLDSFFEDGVRLITVLHDHNNAIGVNQRSQTDGPLTRFGIQVIERMNALGIVVDVAHAKTKTLQGIVDVSAAPVIDSHTSLLPSGSNPSRPTRLRTWAEMEMVAKTGGLICTWPLAYSVGNQQRTTVKHWAEEVLQMKTRLGIEHCGLGTDGGGDLPRTVEGWDSISSLPNLIGAMKEVGLSQEDIGAYAGGNFLRILTKCIG